MLPIWNFFERAGRTRGTAAVMELAAFAALWPYISGGWTRIDPAYAPFFFAVSLFISLILMIALRMALAGMAAGSVAMPDSYRENKDDGTSTVIGPAPAPRLSSLPGRSDLIARLESHEASAAPAALGIIHFANHAPMISYEAAGGRRIMAMFEQRLRAAAGRRLVAQLADDAFGVWFEGHASEAAEELKSLGYVLSQELSDLRLTVLPDVHLGLESYPADGHTARSFISHGLSVCSPLKAFVAPAAAGAAAAEEGPAYRFAMEQALRRAVREGELSLRYQPLIDTAAGRVAGAEVLIRWRHPGFGDVSPALFIPILEKTGLIHDIGLWTLNSACRQLSQWRAAGHPEIKLAINLSAVQLKEPTLKASITRIVASHGLEPADVELELTETAAMEDREATVALFQELRTLGFGIAIDDFGNGHSNFGYLRSLPFTKLKIDREFVTHIDTRPGSQAICKSLVELGAGLGIAILAEGVERLEEVETLRLLGCHLFQGYHFERPQTAVDFTARLGDAEWLSELGSDVHLERAEVKKRMIS